MDVDKPSSSLVFFGSAPSWYVRLSTEKTLLMTRLSSERIRSFIRARNSLNSLTRLPISEDRPAQCRLNQPNCKLARFVFSIHGRVELDHFHAHELAGLRHHLADQVRLAEVEAAGNRR